MFKSFTLMKYTQLPKMKIRNALSSPTIHAHVSSLFLWVKIIALSIFAILAFSVIMYLNMQYEHSILMQQKVSQETDKAIKQNSGVVIDATTAIIKREGKLETTVAKQYAVWVFDAASKYAIDPMLILSVIFVESRFDYKVISSGNAVGLMQIIPYWHKDKATAAELFDPKKNINVGTQIIKEYMQSSSSTIEGLLKYNGSVGQAPVYATKVLNGKRKFEAEVTAAIIASI